MALPRRVSLAAAALLFFGLIGSAVLPHQASAYDYIRDEFTGGNLRPAWTVVRPDYPSWHSGPGSVDLDLLYGDLWGPRNFCKNLFLRPVSGSTYGVEGRLGVNLLSGLDQATFILYADDDNYLQFGLIRDSDSAGLQNYISYVHEVNRSPGQVNLIPYSGSDVSLRMDRDHDSVQFFMSVDDQHWTPIGSISDLGFEPTKAGFVAFDPLGNNLQTGTAQFEHFAITGARAQADLLFDPGSGSNLVLKYEADLDAGDAVQAFVSKGTPNNPGDTQAGPIVSESGSAIAWIAATLHPYIGYYGWLKCRKDGEWSQPIYPQTDIPTMPSVPVVMIHGLYSSPAIWTEFEQQLNYYGAQYTLKAPINGGGYPNDWDFTQNATQLNESIEPWIQGLEAQTVAKTGVEVQIPAIDILAHSMGGLIGRRYANYLGSRLVRHMVELATPDGGVSGANGLFWLSHDKLCLIFPALCQLAASNVGQFNRNYRMPPGVSLYSVAGDASGEAPDCFDPEANLCQEVPFVWRLFSITEGCPNDGIVSVASIASADVQRSGFGIEPVCHESMHSSSDVFNDWVGPIIAIDVPEPPSATSRGAMAQTSTEFGSSAIVESCADLDDGLSDTLSFKGDGGVLRARLWSGDPAVTFALVAPGGSVVDSITALADSNDAWERDGYGQELTVRSAAPGDWKLRLSRSSGGVESPYCAQVFGDGAVQLHLDASRSEGAPGDSVHVAVSVTDGGMTLPSPVIAGTIARTDGGASEPMELYDDGLHGDGGQQDGVFGATRTLGQQGTYVIHISAAGARMNGSNFMRDSRTGVSSIDPALVGVPPHPATPPLGLDVTIGPNPTRGPVKISLKFAPTNSLRVDLYDIRGARVSTLFNGAPVGSNLTLSWAPRSDGARPVPPGVYFLRAVSSRGRVTRTLILE